MSLHLVTHGALRNIWILHTVGSILTDNVTAFGLCEAFDVTEFVTEFGT